MKHAAAKTVLILLTFALGVILTAAGPARAKTKKDLAGWGIDSPYQKLYNIDRYDFFKGTIEQVIDVVPLPGMAMGTALTVRDRHSRLIQVQLGPKSYVDISTIGLKPGDKVKCMGVYAEIAKKRVFIASKVKTGEQAQIKLRRTSDGVPFWAMTLAELSEFTAEFSLDEDSKPASPPFFFAAEPHLHYTTERPMRIFDERTPTAD
jgi:hypothetical protein